MSHNEINEIEGSGNNWSLQEHGLSHVTTAVVQNVCIEGFFVENSCDGVFLDVPSPWEAVENAARALSKPRWEKGKEGRNEDIKGWKTRLILSMYRTSTENSNYDEREWIRPGWMYWGEKRGEGEEEGDMIFIVDRSSSIVSSGWKEAISKWIQYIWRWRRMCTWKGKKEKDSKWRKRWWWNEGITIHYYNLSIYSTNSYWISHLCYYASSSLNLPSSSFNSSISSNR